MPDQLNNSQEPTLPGFDSSMPSLASAGGLLPFDSPDGPMTAKSGPEAAPANLSRPQGRVAARTTPGTSGPISFDSSPSAVLQQSLENKLRARLGETGSPEYVVTWKRWAMSSGAPICALRASARTTYVNVSTGSLLLDGWPKTPMASDGMGGVMQIRPGTKGKYKLRDYAQLAGFPTAKTPTGGPESAARKQELGRKASGGGDLQAVALLAGFPTAQGLAPATEKYNEAGGSDFTRKMETLMGLRETPNGKKAEFLPEIMRGRILGLFFVPTGKRVVLAPEFSLWLMGFPEAWAKTAPGAKDWFEAQAALELECSKDRGTQ